MEMKRVIMLVAALSIVAAQPAPAYAQAEDFASWLEDMKQEALAAGVAEATVHGALDNAMPDERVVELDRRQPESTVSFDAYARRVLTPSRIKKGKELLARHRTLLRDINARYGVPPQVIVALWGVESGFGHNSGDFGVIDSLVTLAYEGRRASFFRNELIEALHLLEEEGMEPSFLRGSWAGAMGQCQFMPSTFRRHAIDYDEDGRRDIWDNEADVFASIAAYLASEGWKGGMAWGREVRATRRLPEDSTGLDRTRTLKEWGRLGVRTTARKPLPVKALSAALVQPDGPGGRSFLVYDNFRALMRWNRSTYFATSVGLLADKLAAR